MTIDAHDLALTKLQPPTLPDRMVARPRLQRQLEAVVRRTRPFVLISAPAGAAKSTTIAMWLNDHDASGAWLQVDSGDNDPARFWTSLAAAIDQIVPGHLAAVRPRIAATGGGADAVVPVIVNALAATAAPLIVVIDDYHLVDSDTVHVGVERLIELCPDNVTIVIATRVDPPFRLGRLRVQGRMTELRARDLRFDTGEAGELLSLTDEQLTARLCERTEGWAAGLVLAKLGLGSASDPATFLDAFDGSDRLVVDYLTDELLRSLTQRQQERLFQTSILQRLSGPLVDAVCRTRDGTTWLLDLAARNQLVISLDRSATWFRYHHLLGDVLRLEAERRMPDRLRGLHRAAATWHHQHGHIDAAVDHYISAGELPTAADLIAEHATHLLNGGQIFTVLRQLGRLGDLAEHHSRAALVRGWTDLVTGRVESARRWFDIARERDDGTDQGIITALGIMISIARGDIAAGIELARRAAPPSESTQAVALGAIWTWAGSPGHARPYLDLAAELAAAEPSDYAASVGAAHDALSILEAGAPIAAASRAADALDHAAAVSMADAPQLALAHAVLACTDADDHRAAGHAGRAVDLARRSSDRTLGAYVLATAGDRLASMDEPAGTDLLRESRALVDQAPDPGIAGTHLARIEARHGLGRPTGQLPGTTLPETLTDREITVLRHLPSQLSQRDIASTLFVSTNTIKTHCRAIYRKLGVNGRKAAVQRGRELGVL